MSDKLIKWNLNDLYESFSSEQFNKDLAEASELVTAINSATENLNGFPALASAINLVEKFESVAHRIYAYAHYIASADTSNRESQKYIYKMKTLDADTSRATVKISSYLSALTPEEIEKGAAENGMADYAYRLKHMAEERSHMMSEDEEALAAKLAPTGSGAWGQLHDKIISDLTCEYEDPKKNGETKTITISECRNLAYDADAKVRKAAYEAELAAYPKILEASAACINGIKGEVNLLSKLRRFDKPIDKTLFSSGMTQKTLDAMFEAIAGDIQVFRDYLKLKAKYLSKKLGVRYDGLPFYDLFAPLGESADKEFTYDEAKQFIYDNFNRFSPKMAATAKRAFDENWLDVYPRAGKVSGAFCGHVYAIKQFRVLLNFGGSISDAITMAHELGHGYHSMNIMNERILNAHYPMPLAETASTFCENVVNNAALATLPDEQKLQILEGSLQDSTQVIVDIYSRYLFEKSVFEEREDHPLSADELNELMLTAQKKAYGDGLDEAWLHPYMWVVKPHYYRGSLSFYNFPYAFGHLLANGLYKIYESDPASFGDKYDAFLSVSGKMSIKDACATMGIDVESKEFWASSIEVVKGKIKEFEKLVK